MTYEQLEKIELYNCIAQFNKKIMKVCKAVNQHVGRYDYRDDLNKVLNDFKEKIPLNIESLDIKSSFFSAEILVFYVNGEPHDIELDTEIGFKLYETEYSMSIFEPEEITYGVILEAFTAAKESGVDKHTMRLAGIEEQELNVLNYDEIISILERLCQIAIINFDHRIEDDILTIDFWFVGPMTKYISFIYY